MITPGLSECHDTLNPEQVSAEPHCLLPLPTANFPKQGLDCFFASLKSGLGGWLYKESHLPRCREALSFFLVRKLKLAWLAPKEKSHQLSLMAFFVAGTGLEPATFGL